MDRERWLQIVVAFERVQEASAEERAAVLDEIGATDPTLRTEIEALLDVPDDTIGAFVSPLPGFLHKSLEEAAAAGPDRLVGRRIGRFQIERLIAKGGMGSVYEATQDQPRRTVALKVIRPELMSEAALHRFEHEWQVLAMLRHENIAQVYDAGIHEDDRGRIPYFAMELIEEATDIIRHADEQALGLRERLGLLIDVCDAVHHGHQKGIIHRDLKPSNILVGPSGRPKVIDFGVAKATGSGPSATTMLTSVARIIGTMQYMSPEQCVGDPRDVDTRSDVYSLGLIAYELLGGQLPYSTAGLSIFAAMRVIRDTIPPSVATLDRRLRGNIEAIITRAIEKNRDRRYQSAQAMKEDIERHLHGDPISARRPSLWARLGRRVRKRPVLYSASLTASLTLIILLLLAGVSNLAVDRYIRSKPVGIWVADDKSSAFMYNIFGKPLAHFGIGSAASGDVVAGFTEMPERLGGGPAVLFKVRRGQHSTKNQLWVCDPDDLDTPLWRTPGVEASLGPWLPQGMYASPPASPHFVVNDFTVADVFPDPPGENEVIVALQQYSGSPSIIRVYDLGGEILFEAWHLGVTYRVAWMAQDRLIVCEGERLGRADVSRYGYSLEYKAWPDVVFALRPERGVSIGWINEFDWPEQWRRDPKIPDHVAWYKTVLPRSLAQPFGIFRLDASDLDVYGVPHLRVRFKNEEDFPLAHFEIIIGPKGEQLGLILGDDYIAERKKGSLPAEDPRLVDWPPADH